jgi:FkbM family methyltransferase
MRLEPDTAARTADDAGAPPPAAEYALASMRSAPALLSLAGRLIRRLPRGRYRLMEAFGAPAKPFRARLSNELGGHQYVCDLRDAVARQVFFTGVYGPQETVLLRVLLRPGMSFVDVGANWGYFSLLAAHLVGSGGRVLALEPDPRVHPLIEANVRMNGLAQVAALRVAAAEAAGVLTLAGFEEDGGNFGISRVMGAGGSHAGPSFQVEGTTLDALLEARGIPAVDLLKMDIEGAEMAALKGLSRSLETGKVRRLLVELHPRELRERGESADSVANHLRAHGYTGFTIDHRPDVTHAVAYGRIRTPEDLLSPISGGELDAWPHQLWCAPGLAVR